MAPLGGKPHRKRMRRLEVPGGARFLTFSCQARLPLFSNDKIALLMREHLVRVRREGCLAIYAWVIMPEHVHVLCMPRGESTITEVLRSAKMSVARVALARWHQLGAPILQRLADATGRPRFWLKGGGFDRNVRDADEFAETFRYIHHNPVVRKLVVRATDWPWSSARFWHGGFDDEPDCDPCPY
jgi:putative transposase